MPGPAATIAAVTQKENGAAPRATPSRVPVTGMRHGTLKPDLESGTIHPQVGPEEPAGQKSFAMSKFLPAVPRPKPPLTEQGKIANKARD